MAPTDVGGYGAWWPLLQAHQELDRAVDRCYRPEPFPSDRHRVEYLFALYEKLTAPLVAAAKSARKRRKQRTGPGGSAQS